MNEPTPPPFGRRIEEEEEDFIMQPSQPASAPDSMPDNQPEAESIFETTADEPIYTAPVEEEQPLIFTEEVKEEIEESPAEPEQTQPVEECPCNCDEPEAESLESKVDRLTDSIDTLSAGLDERFARATQTAELFDRMYSEMAKYKDDLYAKLLKPFILEAVTILEDYRRTLDRLDTLTLDQIKKTLRNIPADMEDLLENNGVDILVSEGENPTYDRKMHQVIRTVETDNPELDGKIAKKLRPGYAWNGTILRQEKVEVYKLKK